MAADLIALCIGSWRSGHWGVKVRGYRYLWEWACTFWVAYGQKGIWQMIESEEPQKRRWPGSKYRFLSQQIHFLTPGEHGQLESISLSLVKRMRKIRRQYCKALGNLWAGQTSFPGIPNLCPVPFPAFWLPLFTVFPLLPHFLPNSRILQVPSCQTCTHSTFPHVQDLSMYTATLE